MTTQQRTARKLIHQAARTSGRGALRSVAVVMVDIKGYSKLSAKGQLQFFEQVLPEIRNLLGPAGAPNPSLLDANTWGDAVMCVFDTVVAAAEFCVQLKRVFRSNVWTVQEFQDLRPRIALHQTHLYSAIDPIRALGTSHYYGSGIVKPARLEPIVQPGHVWVTPEARALLQEAINQQELRGCKIVPLGLHKLPKEYGEIEVAVLLDDNEMNPEIALVRDELALYTSQHLARLSSALEVNQAVENFHLHAAHCMSIDKLDSAFAKHHLGILLRLRLLSRPTLGNESAAFDADVLLLELESGKFQAFEKPTAEQHRRVLPDMWLKKTPSGRFVRPRPGAGLAPYVLWANSAGRLGVGAAECVNGSDEIVYHERRKDVVGAYRPTVVSEMYKHPKVGRGEIPYGSILCAPIGVCKRGSESPEDPGVVEWIGVLNITAAHPLKFTTQDCAWADLMASLLGSLHQSYRSRRQELVSFAEAAAVQVAKSKGKVQRRRAAK